MFFFSLILPNSSCFRCLQFPLQTQPKPPADPAPPAPVDPRSLPLDPNCVETMIVKPHIGTTMDRDQGTQV